MALNIVGKTLVGIIGDESDVVTVIVPAGVETIGDYAFWGCSALTSLTLPDTLTTIRDRAFYGCRALTALTLPDTLTTIRDCAFAGCRALTALTQMRGECYWDGEDMLYA